MSFYQLIPGFGFNICHRPSNHNPSTDSQGIDIPLLIRCQMPTFRRVTRWPTPNMIPSTITDPAKTKPKNSFIPVEPGVFRSARRVNSGTRGPARPRPNPPWRLSGIGKRPPMIIDTPQHPSANAADTAQNHRPDKSWSELANPNDPTNAEIPPRMMLTLNKAGYGASAAPSSLA